MVWGYYVICIWCTTSFLLRLQLLVSFRAWKRWRFCITLAIHYMFSQLSTADGVGIVCHMHIIYNRSFLLHLQLLISFRAWRRWRRCITLAIHYMFSQLSTADGVGMLYHILTPVFTATGSFWECGGGGDAAPHSGEAGGQLANTTVFPCHFPCLFPLCSHWCSRWVLTFVFSVTP